MKKRAIAIILTLIISVCLFSGCDKNGNSGEADTSAAAAPVTLTIAGPWSECKAIKTIGALFTEKYPNCTVVYESINDYYANLVKRMTGDDIVDIFFSANIQSDAENTSAMLEYALDLNSTEGLDLSATFAPLAENFRLREDLSKMYSITLGAEMRGMYVNKTLLKSVGIDKVPTNQAELLADCETLKNAGYIPMQGNPTYFSQWLIYPWVCNNIANSINPEASILAVNNRDEQAISELTAEPFEFLYNITSSYYYDYKTAQKSLNLFNDSTEEDHARYFFNVIDDNGSFKKKDDSAGQIAFMPAPLSYSNTMADVKEDYGSSIEYEFIPAPVGDEGGYVYLSPAHCIAANKNSPNVDWVAKFFTFLFTPENNKVFAEEFNIMPNVKEVFDYASNLYDVPQSHICHIGQVTFDWSFYDLFKEVAIEISKANKPDTVEENGGVMHEFSYYSDMLISKINEAA